MAYSYVVGDVVSGDPESGNRQAYGANLGFE
jgi:hypothetical protein